jgi:hypothetical protein
MALGLLALPALAADKNSPQPGLWEYTMKMEMPGMPFPMPPQTFQHCLTQADVDKGNLAQDPNQKSECQVQNLKQAAGKTSYDVVCTGDHPTQGHYDFTATAATLTGVGTLDLGGGQSMKQNLTAKRAGDCKK